MSTEQSQAKNMAPNKRDGEDDDDVGALIYSYRESQLRKAEAAAAADESKKN